jgi:hypothetical protein
MSGREAYTRWHWGINPSTEVEVKPPPCVTSKADKEKWKRMELVECGRLVEIHYAPLDGSVKRRNKIIKLNKKNSNQCHLAFDNDHKNQRLYFILNEDTRKKMLKTLQNDYEPLPLSELSQVVGGRHATDDYEDIEVKPIGVMTNVVYACEKKGDGYSFYIHALGEESGIQPMLALAEDGSLWFAGGNYTSPVAGITD